jgi:hypothetical protein
MQIWSSGRDIPIPRVGSFERSSSGSDDLGPFFLEDLAAGCAAASEAETAGAEPSVTTS